MRWEVHRVADLTGGEQSALRTLSLAVYPPEVSATWPGQSIEWAPAQWSVVGWDAEGAALCHVGAVLREARWNERAVKVGGIGGVKTHPAVRSRGFASTAIRQALDFFHEQGDVDFGLLVCEPGLVPFYERLGWRKFPGDLFVTQRQATDGCRSQSADAEVDRGSDPCQLRLRTPPVRSCSCLIDVIEMMPLYQDNGFTFRFADDRLIPRFHLEGVEAGRRVSVYKIDPGSGERLGLLATATVGEGGWVDLTEPIIVRAGQGFLAVAKPEE